MRRHTPDSPLSGAADTRISNTSPLPHRPISLAASPIPNLHHHLANPLTTSPILPRILANLPCTLANLPCHVANLPCQLALTPHPARSHLHASATLLAASRTTTSTSQQRTCCETRPATASSSLCRAPPFVWGSGFKGEWASMQGRMGGAAADRDNVCGDVSHAAFVFRAVVRAMTTERAVTERSGRRAGG